MNINRLFALGLATVSLASCDKPLEQGLDKAGVSVAVNDSVVSDGQVITVEKGTPVKFNIQGMPDYATFYSGETGHQYVYRNRTEIDMDQIESSKMTFSITAQYGVPAGIFHLYTSDRFNGLYKDDFKADSLLVEQAAWTDLVPVDDLPQKAGVDYPYEIDMKPYFGKNLTLAVRYEPTYDITNQNQSTVTFSGMKITNVLKNGNVVEVDAGQFGFTPLNMNYRQATKAQINTLPTDLKNKALADLDVLQYATVTNGGKGFWRLDQISTGKFWINASGKGNEGFVKNYSWLVSDYLVVNACKPDAGVSVKNMATTVDSYSYTYDQVGTYTATFVLSNANYEHSSSKVCNLVINVK